MRLRYVVACAAIVVATSATSHGDQAAVVMAVGADVIASCEVHGRPLRLDQLDQLERLTPAQFADVKATDKFVSVRCNNTRVVPNVALERRQFANQDPKFRRSLTVLVNF